MSGAATHGIFQFSGTPPQADVTVDLGQCMKTRSLLQQIGAALAFPTWYGANFDALYDCLSAPTTPATICLCGLSGYARQQPDEFAIFIDVLHAACEARAQDDLPLCICLDTPVRDIPRWPAP